MWLKCTNTLSPPAFQPSLHRVISIVLFSLNAHPERVKRVLWIPPLVLLLMVMVIVMTWMQMLQARAKNRRCEVLCFLVFSPVHLRYTQI